MSIESFIELSKIHASTDYADKKSVRKANEAADSMKEMVSKIHQQNKVAELLSLLNHESAGLWVAYLVADISGINSQHKEKCINKIESIASGDSLDSTAAEYWLKERGYGNS